MQLFFQNNLTLILAIFGGLFIFLTVCLLALFLKLRLLTRKHADFFHSSNIKNLEELILENNKTIKLLDRDIQELFNISNQINSLASRGLHRVGLIRFNPFKDVGGDQSFALAILNGKNNGFTLSSLYTREGTRIYAKSIVAGASQKHPLTQEEKKALDMAIHEKDIKDPDPGNNE